jgi:anion-transporting  ArsA/GET3 family ATPase
LPTGGTFPNLFDRRLVIVAGKGGVGKTTIACALGLIASHLGKRTLLAEVDGVGRAASLLGIAPGTIGDAQPVRPGLSVMSVEGSAALSEYLEIIVPVKRVLQAVFSSRIYQYFVAAAPGLKELMTIGKIWFEAERIDEATGAHRWDLVVLDAPATGHSLQYLGMPRAAHEVFRVGLVGRESQRLVDLLTDPARTVINLVTTAEEMPVNETREMYERIRNDLQMPLGVLFVNRVHDGGLNAEALDRVQGALKVVRDERQRSLAEEALQRAREEVGWTTVNKRYLRQLAKSVAIPMVQVPFLFAEEFGVEQVHRIAALLEPDLVAASKRKPTHGKA